MLEIELGRRISEKEESSNTLFILMLLDIKKKKFDVTI